MMVSSSVDQHTHTHIDEEPIMPVISTGKYLKREHVTEEGAAHRVVRAHEDDISLSDGMTEKKWILELEDLKPMILNSTNIRRLVAAFGTAETDEWIGRSIVVYDDPAIEYGGKVVGGVRLRSVPKKKKVATVSDDIPF